MDQEADIDPEEQEARDAYDAEMRLAAAGEWEALGLDPPGAPPPAAPAAAAAAAEPITISDFLNS